MTHSCVCARQNRHRQRQKKKKKNRLVHLGTSPPSPSPMTSAMLTKLVGNKVSPNLGRRSRSERRGRRLSSPASRRPSSRTTTTTTSTPGPKRRDTNIYGIPYPYSDSFSAVSKPNFASKYSLESSRRDLHDLHFFATLQSQQFSRFSSNIC